MLNQQNYAIFIYKFYDKFEASLIILDTKGRASNMYNYYVLFCRKNFQF